MGLSLLSSVFFLALSVSGHTPPADAASEGVQRWFRCGLRYWTPCQPAARAPDLPLAGPAPESQRSAEPALSPADLALWGTPVVGPSGSVSFQLPPQPLLNLFRAPSDETARAYLQSWKDKAGRREEAFAAIRRVAAELGFERGPSALDDPTTNRILPLDLSSPELPSPGAAASLFPSPGAAVLSTQPLDSSRAYTTVAMPRDGTSLPPRAETAPPAAPPSIVQAATTTQSLPGQRTRIFYFFSPRCPYCAQQTPLLNSVVQGRRDVVGIAMDTERDELLAYVQQMHIGFPVTLDRGESKTFGVTAYPMLVVLDARGKATRLQGLVTRAELERMVGGGT